MSANASIAAIFDEMAAILEILGESRFRVNAYARAARTLRDLGEDVAAVAGEPGRLEGIDGIGTATAAKIREFLESGVVAAHEALRERIPVGLLDVLALPGLGPKTVQALWRHADVTDVPTLEAAIEAGRLAEVPRMGPKTIANLRDAIDFARRATGRTRIGDAMPLAEALLARLDAAEGTTRTAYAGSLRRGRETIGDLDLIACSDRPEAARAAFLETPGIERRLAAGETKCSVRFDSGIQADLRIVPESAFGAALLYFTGSKEHNVRLRERAAKQGRRLNEYGLFPDDGDPAAPQERGVAPIASATEEEIYAALGLPWIPPEMREDAGELDERGDVVQAIADLVRIEDVRSDLHLHTTASDGRLTIEALARLAQSRGLETIAVTDHSRSSAQANGLSVERLAEHVAAIRAADAAIEGITILAGAEVDILADGRLDYDDEVLASLDVVVASPHVALGQEPAKATARLLRAVTHPLVHILGHPTGRLVGRRAGLEPDMRALAEAAAECGTALEINANHHRLDLRDAHVRLAVECGALIAVNTDTHAPDQIEQLRYGIATARRGWLPRERCVNAWPLERLEGWLAKGRASG